MTIDDTLTELTLAQNRMAAQAALLERAQEERDTLIWEAAQSGASHPTIGSACGLTHHRVKQILQAQRAMKKGQDQ